MEHLWTPWRLPYILSDKKKAGCVFCEKASHPDTDRDELVLARSPHAMLVLNMYPYTNGHLMAVPYAHVSSLVDIPGDALHDLALLTRLAEQTLRGSMSPQGFNVGINIGRAGGAGVDDHIHIHIVPRWGGDTNFMTVVGQTRTVPELLADTRERLGRTLVDLGYPVHPDTGTVWVDTSKEK